MRATVIGAAGFIGSRLLSHLRGLGWDCHVPARDDQRFVDGRLGTVFYCAGLTADFAGRPHETVRAHTGLLNEILARAEFDSLVYLSSTRLYDGSAETNARADENTPLALDPARPRHFFDLSKALGEALCRQASGGRARVARLSCVYAGVGNDSGFLGTLLDSLAESTADPILEVDSTPHASRDYVHVDDVVTALTAIATRGTQTVYNVAGGVNVVNAQLFARLGELSGRELCALRTDRPTPPPTISIERMRSEFGWRPTSLMDRLPALVQEARACQP